MGGVHSVTTKDNKVIKFLRINEKVIWIEQSIISEIIINICEITLKGLEPLERVVKRHTLTGGFQPHF